MEKPQTLKKKLTIGILAHVDAGKTTLSEALLFLSGKLRSLGRVDHKNTFLDSAPVERERGITVFSKQARFSYGNCDFILLDTPGHMDFSAETERTLALLDYAILVVSGPDGVQNHTRTLWQLLEYYSVPTFIFINKTDVCIKLAEELEAEMAKALSPMCVAFYERSTKAELDEKLALVHEEFLESFLAGDAIDDGDIATLISERRLFPCLYGSALRTTGVEFLLDALDRYTLQPIASSKDFSARVYKISYAAGTRLTYMKITGGSLSVRDEIDYTLENGKRISEKVSQIRLYSGDRYDTAERVGAGEICALTGLSGTYVGGGLGKEENTQKPILEPVLSYGIELPEDCDPRLLFPKLKLLEEEEPSLHLRWNEELSQIEARLMGDIQIDLLRRMVLERFGVECAFGNGKILYKEKIASRAIGVGHFEPLRHYAEVQLLLEPAPKGSGLIFDVRLPENSLEINWQRLILSHLYEKDHRGTLIGASLTDTKITLVAARAHLKHTEGGDFREATLRAVRHGLMRGGCILLEPFYKFRLELPSDQLGRAMSDLQAKNASFAIEDSHGDVSVICGRAAVSRIGNYAREVVAYTRGKGRLFCTADGYEPCADQEEVARASGYDPESDLENTPHSVFCAHGAGFVVKWDEVESYKHLDAELPLADSESIIPRASGIAKRYKLNDDELEEIMLREFGPIKRKKYSEPRVYGEKQKERKAKKKAIAPPSNIIIIDGYNVIHSWDSLKELADFSLEKARQTLMDVMSDYVAFTKCEAVLVFDAYLVKDGSGSDFMHDGYRVVYTREDQTADAFIEHMMFELGPDYSIKVVTGDKLVQFSAVSSGILRMTAKEFEDDVRRVGNEITEFIKKLADRKQ